MLSAFRMYHHLISVLSISGFNLCMIDLLLLFFHSLTLQMIKLILFNFMIYFDGRVSFGGGGHEEYKTTMVLWDVYNLHVHSICFGIPSYHNKVIFLENLVSFCY